MTEFDALRRQVLHALELAGEDVERWCGSLSRRETDLKPFGIASVGFHLRHIARSLDRLLTYAEGRQLTPEQRVLLETESAGAGEAAIEELRAGLLQARARIIAFDGGTYEERREVGRDRLPSSVGGLLVHVAEHTQRHVGQAVTTAQVVTGLRAKVEGVNDRGASE